MNGQIEKIRQRYGQFSLGDVRGATRDWAEDIIWEGGNSAELPIGGTHHGKAEAIAEGDALPQRPLCRSARSRHAPVHGGRPGSHAGHHG